MAIDITEIKNKILTFNEELIEFQENINNYKTEQYGAGSFSERRNSINLLDQVKELSIATSYILDGGVSGGISEWTHTGSIDEYFDFSGSRLHVFYPPFNLVGLPNISLDGVLKIFFLTTMNKGLEGYQQLFIEYTGNILLYMRTYRNESFSNWFTIGANIDGYIGKGKNIYSKIDNTKPGYYNGVINNVEDALNQLFSYGTKAKDDLVDALVSIGIKSANKNMTFTELIKYIKSISSWGMTVNEARTTIDSEEIILTIFSILEYYIENIKDEITIMFDQKMFGSNHFFTINDLVDKITTSSISKYLSGFFNHVSSSFDNNRTMMIPTLKNIVTLKSPTNLVDMVPTNNAVLFNLASNIITAQYVQTLRDTGKLVDFSIANSDKYQTMMCRIDFTIENWNVLKNSIVDFEVGFADHLIEDVLNIKYTDLRILMSLSKNKMRAKDLYHELHNKNFTNYVPESSDVYVDTNFEIVNGDYSIVFIKHRVSMLEVKVVHTFTGDTLMKKYFTTGGFFDDILFNKVLAFFVIKTDLTSTESFTLKIKQIQYEMIPKDTANINNMDPIYFD